MRLLFRSFVYQPKQQRGAHAMASSWEGSTSLRAKRNLHCEEIVRMPDIFVQKTSPAMQSVNPPTFFFAPKIAIGFFGEKRTRTTSQPTLIQQGPASMSIVVWCPVIPNTAFIGPEVTSQAQNMRKATWKSHQKDEQKQSTKTEQYIFDRTTWTKL